MNMRPAPPPMDGDARFSRAGAQPTSPSRNATPKMTSTNLRTYLSKKSGICSAPPFPNNQSSNGATKNVNNA